MQEMMVYIREQVARYGGRLEPSEDDDYLFVLRNGPYEVLISKKSGRDRKPCLEVQFIQQLDERGCNVLYLLGPTNNQWYFAVGGHRKAAKRWPQSVLGQWVQQSGFEMQVPGDNFTDTQTAQRVVGELIKGILAYKS